MALQSAFSGLSFCFFETVFGFWFVLLETRFGFRFAFLETVFGFRFVLLGTRFGSNFVFGNSFTTSATDGVALAADRRTRVRQVWD